MENNNGNKERISYLDKFDRNILCPISDHEINWYADQLLEWAHKDTSVTLLGFSGEYMVSQARLYEWEKKFPRLEEAMSVARSLIGGRREKLALENKYNAGIVNRTLGVYDDRVRAYDKEMKAASSGEEKSQTVNVVLPPMPTTDAVPKKKSRKKDE